MVVSNPFHKVNKFNRNLLRKILFSLNPIHFTSFYIRRNATQQHQQKQDERIPETTKTRTFVASSLFKDIIHKRENKECCKNGESRSEAK